MSFIGKVVSAGSVRRNTALRNEIKMAVELNGNRMRVNVHPNSYAEEYARPARFVFGIPKVKDMELVRYLYGQCFHEEMAAKYHAYIKRQEGSIKRYDGFQVVLALDPAKTEKWLRGMKFPGITLVLPTVGVEADEMRDPTPKFTDEEGKGDTWGYFAKFLKGLGVTDVEIAGEVAFTNSTKTFLVYQIGNGKEGCVPAAEDGLSKHFRVKVNSRLTFPNMDINSERLEEYLVNKYFNRVNFYDGMIDIVRFFRSINPFSRA